MAAFILHRLGWSSSLQHVQAVQGAISSYLPEASLLGNSGSAKRRLVTAMKSALPSRSICSPSDGSESSYGNDRDRNRLLEYLRHLRIGPGAVTAHIEFLREGA